MSTKFCVQESNLPQWIKDDAVTRIAAHDALMAALDALSALTTACATNAAVMREIDLSVYDAAVDAEGIARDELDAARNSRGFAEPTVQNEVV